jgi:hypothetical protein
MLGIQFRRLCMHSTEFLYLFICFVTLFTQKYILVILHCEKIKNINYAKFIVFWDVKPYDFVGGYQHFEGK